MTEPRQMKILLLDIETAPIKAFVWGLFDKYIPIDRIEAPKRILCWAAKWAGSEEMLSCSEDKGYAFMIKWMHNLLDEADVVVHYNGTKFDVPTLNGEFAKLKYAPPSPYKQVDLYKVVKQKFRFASNKLDYVSKELDLGQKMKHEGFQLWVKAMEGDDKALRKLQAYNKQDVILLEKLYEMLRPWVDQHPNHGAYTDVRCCPKCGSTEFQRRGTVVTHVARYFRYQCQKCGGWFRGSENQRKQKGEKTRNVTP